MQILEGMSVGLPEMITILKNGRVSEDPQCGHLTPGFMLRRTIYSRRALLIIR